jgi:hypothetical protein
MATFEMLPSSKTSLFFNFSLCPFQFSLVNEPLVCEFLQLNTNDQWFNIPFWTQQQQQKQQQQQQQIVV